MVHRQFEIEIQIVDHCNLNCDNCNHFSNLATPWFMSTEEFEFSITKIREEFYPHGLKRLMILGGEPLLHPQIKEFCDFARKTFPEKQFKIDILTNGIKLKDMSQEDLDYLSSRANFCITPYPNVNYSEYAQNLLLDGKLGRLASRLFFVSTNIDLEPKESAKKNYENCPKYSLPCYFVKNYKIYICPFSGCVHIFNEKFGTDLQVRESDYIDLHTATMEDLEKLRKDGPQHICQHCSTNCLPVYWSNGSKRELSDYLGIKSRDLFKYEYEKYNKLINGSDLFNKFRNENYLTTKSKLLDIIDTAYCTQKTNCELSRVNGKIDIIIPYYNITLDICLQLYETLKQQTIIQDCHIYLISDCSNYDDIVFDVFDRLDLNVTFLKTPKRMGPGGARQVGIDNSYNSTLFFLDSDDILINPKGLEEMYELMIETKADIVSGISCQVEWNPEDNYQEMNEYIWFPGQMSTQDVHCLLYNREFLINNNIRFKDMFIAEDADFNYQVCFVQPVVELYEQPTYLYRRNMPTSIGVETSCYDKLLNRILGSLNSEKYKSIGERWYNILYADDLHTQYTGFDRRTIETMIGISFFIAYQFYQTLSEEDKQKAIIDDKDNYMYLLTEQIHSNNLQMKINGKIYKTKTDYIDLINSIIENSVIKDNLQEGLAKWMM